ncbi:hypothetical protein GPEL0_01f2343 [Geoanaerobacter pelophilus]|uniref:Uncharacterized protein n=1 Tax=Geoanaerobacter pelophilus TaxID=60036 RepID=A0ABQ0MIB1_9BACT|nr:hypothetical protein GPEL0_01f2343 [Geoanaerobacter pelophilus]
MRSPCVKLGCIRFPSPAPRAACDRASRCVRRGSASRGC